MPSYKTLTVPFQNLGIQQRIDPGQLREGQFKDQVNVVSIQEGAITTRNGSRELGTVDGNLPHTGARLRVNSLSAYNYVGEGQDIYRSTAWSGLVPVNSVPVVEASDAIEKRWSAVAFNAGSGGDPYMYFACPLTMLKDYGRSAYTSLAHWGLLPPPFPAQGAAIAITPVTINGGVTTLTFASTDYEAETIFSGSLDLSAFGDGTASGSQSTGYDSDDPIELEIELNNPEVVEDIRLQIDVSGGAYTDYYEKPIIPSTLSSMVQLQNLPVSSLETRQFQVDQGVSGNFSSPDDTTAGFIPAQLPPANTYAKAVLKIPKSEFGRVNRAGTEGANQFNWSVVSGVRIYAKASDIAGAPTVKINYIKMTGGAGPNSEAPTATRYEYVYTFRDVVTGQESNPSQAMIESRFVKSERQKIRVTVGGTSDAQVSTSTGRNSIAIYRRGGLFTDEFYRLVGFVANPGVSGSNFPNETTFDDSASDDQLRDAKVAEFDNDAPVLSTLPTPFDGIMQGFIGASTGVAGWNDFNVDLTVTNVLLPGSQITVGIGQSQETVTIWDCSPNSNLGNNGIRAYFQNDHTSGGDKIICNAVAGQPCSLAAQVGDSIYLAGDTNNPHVLYKSKAGKPDAFPLVELASGVVDQVNVGSPSNPIMQITEFNGSVICMNLEKIYQVQTFQGVLQTPIETPAQRGLICRHAWCKADNELWYLAYDGIYSWSGGQSRKRSEQIDWMFKNKTVNGVSPIDLGRVNPGAQNYVVMAYHNNEIFVTYRDVNNLTRRLRYSTLYDRWCRDDEEPTMMFVEKDTGRFICGEYDPTAGRLYEDDMEGTTGTSDRFTDALGENGTPIAFQFSSGFFTAGEPTVQKRFQDIILELENPDAEVTVRLYYDYSTTADTTDTFTIPAAQGRRRVPLPIQATGSPQTTSGKEAYAVGFEFSGSGVKHTTFYSLTFNYFPLEQIQRGRVSDWLDVGHPHDKRFYQFIAEFDTKGASVDLVLDTISGVDGNTETLGVQTFTLTGAQRSLKTFPFIDGVIAKKVRLRPKTTAIYAAVSGVVGTTSVNNAVRWVSGDKFVASMAGQPLSINGAVYTVLTVLDSENLLVSTTTATLGTYDYSGTKAGDFIVFSLDFNVEKYPADIVPFTEYNDYGHPWDKYFQEATFEVDTNARSVPVAIQVDGATIHNTTINTTYATRKVRLTLPPNVIGKQIRILTGTVPTGGKFQLFNVNFVWLKADKGPTHQSSDWDDLDHPFDKKLSSITFEYDHSAMPAGGPVGNTVMNMDTITGIHGDIHNISVQQFTLLATARGKQTFAIRDGVIVKMVRIYPVADAEPFQVWPYQIDKVNYPKDDIAFTEWDNLGYACEKILRWLVIDVDTGGVAASVAIQADGTTRQTISINTTTNDRCRIIAMDSDIIGKEFRLVPTSGTGGKFQLFTFKFEIVREPCAIDQWDSYEQVYGHNGWKFMKQIWLEYMCSSQITMRIYRDNNELFYTKILPPHIHRDVERFYLPAINGSALNKSKVYRITTDADTPMKLYRDGSRLETKQLSDDQRAGFNQHYLWETEPIPI